MTDTRDFIFLNATNISRGGGRSLLVTLIESIPDVCNVIVQIDERLEIPVSIGKNITFRRVPATLFGRLSADYWVKKNSKKTDLIICFGSLPLFFGSRARQIVFVQNLYLIEDRALTGFSLKTMLRIKLERFWFDWGKGGVWNFIVQSQSMKRILLKKNGLKQENNIYVFPFSKPLDLKNFDTCSIPLKINLPSMAEKFIYVASGEPHKNHKLLIYAWCELASNQIYPVLFLTIDPNEFKGLCEWIDEKISAHKLKVINLGLLPHDEVLGWYTKVDALIYPSLFESFGLPLIEASNTGLPIIASELDYVRDISDPLESFDPNSSISIARSVGRFLKIKLNRTPVIDASQFIENILDIARSKKL